MHYTKKKRSALCNDNIGTFCLLLQFFHHKLNAVSLAKKMNKLTALKHKMQVTGNRRSDSNNDRHAGRELGWSVAPRHSNWEWNSEMWCVHCANATCWKPFGRRGFHSGGGGLLNRDKTWIKINMCRQCSCVRTDTSFSITAGAVADGMKTHTWCKAKVQLCFPRSSKLSHLVCASVQQMGKGLVSACVLLACVEGVNLKRVLLLLLRIMWEYRQASVSKIHRYSNTVYIYHFIFQFKCKKLGYLNSGELQRIQRGITHSFQAIFVFQSVRPIFTWLTYPAWLTTE